MKLKALISALALSFAAPFAAAASFGDTFDSGLSGWTALGDVAIVDGAVALTTASASFEDDIGLALNLSGNEALAAGIPDGLEHGLGLSPGALDGDVLSQATEGSALVRTFSVSAGDRLSFDWMLSTLDTASSGFGLDFAFVVIDGVRIDLAAATSASLPGSGPYATTTGWKSFEYVFASGGQIKLGIGITDVADYAISSRLDIDNFAITAVPEPESYAMFVAGLGLIGALARSRRRV
ncbi:PEP-CTERM sorting domain-containing protein [Methyloversatilis thermotolerans]|uniref:PEP-CTERM sorting domain-containing protein n=1 Tax=Methyloversatilis thermotolerans TaxID=1346290 RepID=UPI000476F2C0|nr:PEP-CTERM sorting domain-containing protein [Methyloversatilis thermotolerans]